MKGSDAPLMACVLTAVAAFLLFAFLVIMANYPLEDEFYKKCEAGDVYHFPSDSLTQKCRVYLLSKRRPPMVQPTPQ
jgi:hypothetical protein